ncbi:MAG: UvrD-helicase domain-containing protein [Phycisphaerales bacterium JB064]
MRREQRAYTLEDLWRALAEADLDTQHVAYRLDAQYDHVLLDEFQDTSIDQWRVLEPLIDEAVAGGDRSRSVFVVGDVKQSLYGWRNAQADLLPHVAERWPQMHTDTLKKTYRCAPEIIDAVNLLFGSLATNEAFTDHGDAVDHFANEFEEHESAVSPGAMVRVVDIESQLGDEIGDDDLAQLVARRVAEVHVQRPEADIAILVRRQKPIGRIIAALASHGIRAIADAASTPCDHPVVEAVLSALQLAEHPGDGPALYAVANSPLGAALECPRWDDRAASAKASRRIAGWVFEEGIARTVERLCTLAAVHTNARGRQRLADLVAQAEAYESEPPRWAGVDDFIAFARSARVRPHGSGLVRVLTLHGAKGLQFDAVFLADLDGQLATRPPAILADADGLEDEDPSSPPSRLSLAGTADIRKHSRVLSEIHARWRSRSVYEELCLLYVGMTRAKRHLELLVRPSTKGLGAAAWNGLGAEGPVHETGSTSWLAGSVTSAPQPTPTAAPTWGSPSGVSEAWAVGREPWRVAVVQPSQLGASGGVASLLATSATAADLGSEVHRLLESVEWLEDAGEDPSAWGAPAIASAGEAGERIRTALTHGSLRGVLSRDAIEHRWGSGYDLTVRREMPLSVPMDVDGRPALVRGRIDRLVLGMKAGQVERCLIIDFKTGATGENALGQIELYRRAATLALRANPDSIEAELISI